MADDYKDVMLSKAPPSAVMPQHTGFENFKGILLCDRPADQKVVHGPSQQPFLPPGNVEEHLGLPPSTESGGRHETARANQRTQKNRTPALTQHRKELTAMKDRNSKARLDAFEKELDAENKKQKFQEQQKSLRSEVLQNRHAYDMPSPPSHTLPNVPPPPISHVRTPPLGSDPSGPMHYAPHPPLEEEDEDDYAGMAPPSVDSLQLAHAAPPPPQQPVASAPPRAKPPSGKKPKKKKDKPKWAMTQEEAIEAELRETDDLLRFAQDLDVEKWMQDYEVREALSIVRERVAELVEEEGDAAPMAPGRHYNDDTASEAPSEALSVTSTVSTTASVTAKTRRKHVRHADRPTNLAEREDGWDNISTTGSVNHRRRKIFTEEAMKLAEKLMTNSPALKEVHSKQSLAKILEEVIKQGALPAAAAASLGAPATDIPEVLPGARPAPTVIAHHPNETVPDAAGPKQDRILTKLQKSKDYVQNLPYMYRCPSI